ncbi:desmethylxanthohumol 6'-O-methyltransferase-like [Bidens hawaiensis]|uniref:desmethylxanthohumol 6'-O-methyltransferase-like n=1 Tax=Bidens hawaiensis TaxID=980011 RepID=UPI00404AFAD3
MSPVLATRKEDDATIRGQAWFYKQLHAGYSTAALRCAVQLDIAGIINSHDGPISLSQIANGISSPLPNVDRLSRLTRFMVHKQIFDEVRLPGREEPLYSINECSKFLLQNTSNTLAPLTMLITDPLMFVPFLNLNQSIQEGGTAAFKTYGMETWELFSLNPQANKIFNEAMVSSARIEIDAIMSTYDFSSLKGTLVDVGGGVGATLNEIVTKYPHLKGINFDLPHVISSAPSYEGIAHVGGDMFTSIPHADSFFIKSILHNWSDDKCVQILKNCRESMTEKTGKVIIADIVLNPACDDAFDDVRISLDMIMLTCFVGGKERTEAEWKRILEEAGFQHYNFIKIPMILSIIECYME